MITIFSWRDFLYGTLAVTGVYYVFIAVLFYRRELMSLLSGGHASYDGVAATEDHHHSFMKHDTHADADARLFSAVHDLLEDLKSFWHTAKQGTPVRAELLLSLQKIAACYPQLKDTAFQVAINNQILLEANHFCSITLDDHELKSIWTG